MGFKPDLDDQLVFFSALTRWFGHPACKNRPRKDLLCVDWDVKPYTVTSTLPIEMINLDADHIQNGLLSAILASLLLSSFHRR